MNWVIRRPQELTDAERSAWTAAQRENRDLDSPYFCLQWCDALAAVGRPVEVGVAATSDGLLFLPYERDGRRAHPTGRMINDYQGLIGTQAALRHCDAHTASKLCDAADLSSIAFDHALGSQAAFAPFAEVASSSPYIDLSAGLEAYADGLSSSGKRDASTTRRKQRKMEREVGPLQMTYRSTDRAALQKLIEWKSAQYEETNVANVFSHEWTRSLLENLIDIAEQDFQAVMTTLHAGDELVSVHFGMQSRGVLHWWFPTYNAEWSQYSPGRVLLQMLIDQGPDLGVSKIDLGKGMSSYKERTMSAETPLVEGVVEQPSLSRWVRRSAQSAKAWLKRTPLRKPLSVPANWVYRYMSRRAMQ